MPITPRALFAVLAVVVLAAVALMWSNPGEGVVVYTSVDPEFALPFFEQFTKATGIKVISRTDSEATKTTGLVDRLVQLKDQPDGDVFWNSELGFTQVLAEKDVLQPYASPQAKDIPAEFKDAQNRWTGFGCRARVLIYNTNKVKREEVPRTLEGLADPRWKGRFLIAKPLFGTTRSHLVSFVVVLGEEKAFNLFRSWRDNGLVLADGNSDVRNRVAEGTFELGLTDSDDVLSAMDRNKPVDFVIPDQTAEWPGAYLIPNTVCMLKNCPHPKEAQVFIDYLLRPETETWLAEQGARQIPVRPVPAKLPDSLRNLKPAVFDSVKLTEQMVPMADRIYDILRGVVK